MLAWEVLGHTVRQLLGQAAINPLDTQAFLEVCLSSHRKTAKSKNQTDKNLPPRAQRTESTECLKQGVLSGLCALGGKNFLYLRDITVVLCVHRQLLR